jgi:hypothetical protein
VDTNRIGLVVTMERIVSSAFQLTDPFWSSSNWELLMVLIILISVLLILFGFVRGFAKGFHSEVFVRENPLSHFLFKDTRSAPLWLVVRLYVGFVFCKQV